MRELGSGHLAPLRPRAAKACAPALAEPARSEAPVPESGGQGAEEMCVFSSHSGMKREREMEIGQGGCEPDFSHAQVYGKADVSAAIVKMEVFPTWTAPPANLVHFLGPL